MQQVCTGLSMRYSVPGRAERRASGGHVSRRVLLLRRMRHGMPRKGRYIPAPSLDESGEIRPCGKAESVNFADDRPGGMLQGSLLACLC